MSNPIAHHLLTHLLSRPESIQQLDSATQRSRIDEFTVMKIQQSLDMLGSQTQKTIGVRGLTFLTSHRPMVCYLQKFAAFFKISLGQTQKKLENTQGLKRGASAQVS